MKKGQVLTGIVERVDFPNKGIVITDEGSCTVKNVLPGQKVTFVVSKKRNGRAEGRLLQVEENSSLEVGSPCPHFGDCGGCTYLSLPYEEQLRIKVPCKCMAKKRMHLCFLDPKLIFSTGRIIFMRSCWD